MKNLRGDLIGPMVWAACELPLDQMLALAHSDMLTRWKARAWEGAARREGEAGEVPK